jgi:hypothetical protein
MIRNAKERSLVPRASYSVLERNKSKIMVGLSVVCNRLLLFRGYRSGNGAVERDFTVRKCNAEGG